MARSRFVFALSLVVGGLHVGCSHPQEAGKGRSTGSLAELDKSPSSPAAADKGDGKDNLTDASGNVIYFDYDSRALSENARPLLAKIAETAKKTNASIRIEGNTDERGTTEYNLALGEERARAAKDFLQKMGIPGHKVEIVTYGSERPKADGHDESAWAKNRRAEIGLK